MSILFTEDNYLSRKIGRYLNKEKREFRFVSGTSDALDHVLNNILEGNTNGLIFMFDDLTKSNWDGLSNKIRFLEDKNKVKTAEANVIVLLTTHEERRAYLTKRFKTCDYVLAIPADGKKLAMILEASKHNHFQIFPKSA